MQAAILSVWDHVSRVCLLGFLVHVSEPVWVCESEPSKLLSVLSQRLSASKTGVKPTGPWHKLTSLTAAMTTENKQKMKTYCIFIMTAQSLCLPQTGQMTGAKNVGKKRDTSVTLVLPSLRKLPLSLFIFTFIHKWLNSFTLSFFLPFLLAAPGGRAWK